MRPLVFKLILFATTIAIWQLVLSMVSGFRDTPSTVRALEQSVNAGVDILYLGDSTLYKGASTDMDHSTLPQIVDDMMPEMSVAGIHHDAYHVELFELMCRNALDRPLPPKVIVFPMHLRSFSVERYQRPEYQFVREKLFFADDSPLFRAFFHPLAVFGFYDLEPVSAKEFEGMSVHTADGRLGTVAELLALPEPERQQQRIRAFYGYSLARDHPNLRALQRVIRLCKDNNVVLIAYIAPIDHFQGDREIGPGFSETIRANTAVVAEVMAEQGAQLYNFAFDPDFIAEEFATKEIPDAHLNASAKRKLARKLVEAIYAVLPGDRHIATNNNARELINSDSQ